MAYRWKYRGLMEKLVRESKGEQIFAGLKQPTMYRRIKAICLREGFEGRGLHGIEKILPCSGMRNICRG